MISPNGRESLPGGLVAPIRLPDLGATALRVEVELPAVVVSAAAGDSLRLVISTTDFAYRLPREPRLYDISLADSAVTVPLVATQRVTTGTAAYWWLIGAGVIIAALAMW